MPSPLWWAAAPVSPTPIAADLYGTPSPAKFTPTPSSSSVARRMLCLTGSPTRSTARSRPLRRSFTIGGRLRHQTRRPVSAAADPLPAPSTNARTATRLQFTQGDNALHTQLTPISPARKRRQPDDLYTGATLDAIGLTADVVDVQAPPPADLLAPVVPVPTLPAVASKATPTTRPCRCKKSQCVRLYCEVPPPWVCTVSCSCDIRCSASPAASSVRPTASANRVRTARWTTRGGWRPSVPSSNGTRKRSPMHPPRATTTSREPSDHGPGLTVAGAIAARAGARRGTANASRPGVPARIVADASTA